MVRTFRILIGLLEQAVGPGLDPPDLVKTRPLAIR